MLKMIWVMSRRRPQIFVSTVLLVTVCAGSVAQAMGEEIRDVRVIGNSRTNEDTVRSLAGVRIGDFLAEDTLSTVRERLNTAGLFADVNVWWETYRGGVRVNIAVKDKFPWAPVPTGSLSSNNKSVGLLFVHGNLFGRGKQMVVGGRLASLDSGALIAYRDPSLFGSWVYWEMRAILQRQVIPEYDVNHALALNPWRQSTFDSYGFEPAIGVAWFRRVRTQVSWRRDRVTYLGNKQILEDPTTGLSLPADPEAATSRGGVMGMGRAMVAFDWRSREFAIMRGIALTGSVDLGSSAFGGDFEFWRASTSWEQGVRILRRQNLIYSLGGTVGNNIPIWWDPTAGGPGLRGYLAQQFRGDTAFGGHVEYHFPLLSLGSLDIRGLGFYDTSLIWNRNLPSTLTPLGGYLIRTGYDQRTYDPRYVKQGLDLSRDFHNAVGGGLRFFLRSVAVPLVGFDAGYGLEAHNWQFLLIVGA
jgi:outer membrane protein assembly factor BamA